METIKKIWFQDERIFLETHSNKILSRPLEAFPRLKEATSAQRKSFEIGKDKTDIRWKEIDEDIYISSFFENNEPKPDNSISRTLKAFPELNISALSKEIGINKSLMAKYIYGIKKPSEERKKQIENTLHKLGKELLAVKL